MLLVLPAGPLVFSLEQVGLDCIHEPPLHRYCPLCTCYSTDSYAVSKTEERAQV
ncbi:hypothetical protein SOVF_015400 [Spinacia oleracea]|nr:hypothetical protein SOVF_015400 [Spinacia oleracea]